MPAYQGNRVPDATKRQLGRLAQRYRAGRLALFGPAGDRLPDRLVWTGKRRARAATRALSNGDGWAARLASLGDLWHIVLHAPDLGLPPHVAHPLALWEHVPEWKAAISAHLGRLPYRACLQIGNGDGDGDSDGRVHAHVILAVPPGTVPPSASFRKPVRDGADDLARLVAYVSRPPLEADWRDNAWRVGLYLEARARHGGRLPRLAWLSGVPNARTWHAKAAPALPPLEAAPGAPAGLSAAPGEARPMAYVFRLPPSRFPGLLSVSSSRPLSRLRLPLPPLGLVSGLAPDAAFWPGISSRGSPRPRRSRAPPVTGRWRAVSRGVFSSPSSGRGFTHGVCDSRPLRLPASRAPCASVAACPSAAGPRDPVRSSRASCGLSARPRAGGGAYVSTC